MEFSYIVTNQEIIQVLDKSERNTHLVLCLYGQVNEGLFTTYEEIMDENVLAHGPASGQETRGRTNLKKLDESYLHAYPDAKISIQDIIASGDKVVVRWRWHGTHEGIYKSIKPTHRRISIDGVHIYLFNNSGKIIEIWANHDRLGELEQLGQFSI